MVDLSIVIIGRNQAWCIAKTIESVLEKTAHITNKEILYVDSDSSDETVDIATQYPINVLRLPGTQRLSAAAGRTTGYRYTTGKYILFVDGDMELWDRWVEQAMSLLDEDPQTAAICGHFINIGLDFDTADYDGPGPDDYPDTVESITSTAGIGMYRRSVLDEVGPFNPFVYSDEEPELSIRIHSAGYHILRPERPAVFHRQPPPATISTMLGRRGRNLYKGFGQNIRYHATDGLLIPYMKHRGFVLVPAVWLLLTILSLIISLIRSQPLWFVGWVLVTGAIILLDGLRKRSLYRGVYSFIHRLIILDGTLRGLTLSPTPPEDYPQTVEVVKQVADLQPKPARFPHPQTYRT